VDIQKPSRQILQVGMLIYGMF